MEAALDNVVEGQNELLKYYDTVRGNRQLILKIFGVLITFVVFFTWFYA